MAAGSPARLVMRALEAVAAYTFQGLQIEARGGAGGAAYQVAHRIETDRLIDELAAGDARVDCFKNIHHRPE
jgi:hypothetical protein